MRSLLPIFSSDDSSTLRGRIVGVYVILITANLSAWAWALIAFAERPVLVGTAVLAYSLGLRHALDPDHIAAIDNVTRKLMQEGKRPVAVGLFFALGHSTVVVLASLAVALAAHAVTDEFARYREIGGVIGTSASALFLFIIAMANLVVLRGVYRAFRQVKRGELVREEDIDAVLQQRGWLAGLFRPLFRFVSKSWHLYPIGLLFALGFETASEISLFGLSAEASTDLSSWSILIFPTLFAAAMTLVDTTDGVLMIGAYGWAYRKPIRKLFYNLTITSMSVLVALVIGGIEALGLLVTRFNLTGPFWDAIANLNGNFGVLGYGIVGVFVACWAASIIVYRLKGYDRFGANMLVSSSVAALVGGGVALASTFGTSATAADANGQQPDGGLPLKTAPKNRTPDHWTGFYFGGHFGYSRGSGANTLLAPDPAPSSASFGSLYGGVQLGYNYLLPSRLLVGFEGDISFPNFLDDGVVTTRATSYSAVTEKVDFVSTWRGRFGYAFDHWLVYGTGGFAWSQARFLEDPGLVNPEDKILRTRAGWTIGAGAELPLAAGWTARLEYLYDHLGSTAGASFPSGTGYQSTAIDLYSLRVGLTRQLGWPGAGTSPSNGGDPWPIDPNNWNVHGQFTYIQQGYFAFHSPYEGANSLSGASQTRDTATATAFLGLCLWNGAEFYVNPELDQGFGLSDTLGVAAFPNGEAQKSQFPDPRFNVDRVFLRQTFGLGGEQETIEDGPNQLAGKQDISRVTVTVGKLAVADFFDLNSYAYDPRTTFLNWNIYGGGSYDWTMDKLAWTWGGLVDLNQKNWAFRAGYFLVPVVSNSNDFDTNIPWRGEYTAELELRYSLFAQPGKLRLFGWVNRAEMGSYLDALAMPVNTPNYPDITQTRELRTNYGFVANVEQAISGDLGVFSRATWSPGLTEIIGWTDCDQSLSLGTVLKGTAWRRPDDKIGVAGVVEGLSPEARAYFAAGGLGILIGDGQLNYRPEQVLEAYYAYSLNKWTTLTFDYQFIANPGYNADRGPVSIYAARLHAEF
ncbi:MAG: HoxN/HupN/NixA family nickel/cobalt transporter [Xanthobacteraceae bacterium]